MPTSIIRECSNSALHLGQIRIQVGICHLERVTAKKLESIHATGATVHLDGTKLNQVLCVAELRALSGSSFLPKAKIPEGISLKASSDFVEKPLRRVALQLEVIPIDFLRNFNALSRQSPQMYRPTAYFHNPSSCGKPLRQNRHE
jgi:hypothetical protein